MKQNAKVCAIGEKNVLKLEVFILGGQRRDGGKGRERTEKGSRERIEIIVRKEELG